MELFGSDVWNPCLNVDSRLQQAIDKADADGVWLIALIQSVDEKDHWDAGATAGMRELILQCREIKYSGQITDPVLGTAVGAQHFCHEAFQSIRNLVSAAHPNATTDAPSPTSTPTASAGTDHSFAAASQTR